MSLNSTDPLATIPSEKVSLSTMSATVSDTPSPGLDEKNIGHFPRISEEHDDDSSSFHVVRGLKARHLSMISLGGTIGGGLFIGTASNLADAGPVSMLICYMFIATLTYSIAMSLGEMTTFIPLTGSFTQFSTRFVSPSFGAAVGWLYWFSWAMTFAVELNAAAMVIQYWTDAVPVAAWISIFFVLLSATNFLAVRYYGEIEFWMAAIKVVAIVGWLLYAFIMVCGAGQTGPVGFRYWRNPGPWGPGILVSSVPTGRFLGFLSTLVNAAFTYQGTELVGITAGEAANPRKAVPKAVNKVFFRIVIFFLGSVLFIGLLVPWNDPKLSSDESYTASSPFVIAIVNSGTKVLPHIFNAVILSTMLSAGNSDVYIGSRVLYALAESGVAPSIFLRTTRQGVPYINVALTAVFGALAYLQVSNTGITVFNWLVNISAVAGMICWCSISLSHIRFMKALKVQGFSRKDLPFVAPFNPAYAWYALVVMILIIFIQGFSAFFGFTATAFFTAYVSLIVFVVLWAAFQLLFQCPLWIRAEDMDLDSGRLEIERVQWVEEPPRNLWEKFWNVIA
uniref:ARAD1D09482p n=1 Tax=Blastobotrys adeninivorans TaxID=409370 RepID=A0A060TEP8_BLAAD